MLLSMMAVAGRQPRLNGDAQRFGSVTARRQRLASDLVGASKRLASTSGDGPPSIKPLLNRRHYDCAN